MPTISPLPDRRQLQARLGQLGAVAALAAAAIGVAPGLDQVRARVSHASASWLIAAAAFELLSTLSYVLIFRSVFCPRMSWRRGYLIGMSEQAANAVLPAGGAGGLALGAWALRRHGLSSGYIARRTVAFFLLTSLANVATLIAFAVLFATGAVGADHAPAFTYGFAGAGAVAIAATLALPRLGSHLGADEVSRRGRLRAAARYLFGAISAGADDAVGLVRRPRIGVVVGSFGYMACDISVLGACFQAFGHPPALGVLVVAYLIGQLGGLLPIPGGIGGIEGGLIGTFAIYHVPLAATATAVIAYRAYAIWVPALLGGSALVRLRSALRHARSSVGHSSSDYAELVLTLEPHRD